MQKKKGEGGRKDIKVEWLRETDNIKKVRMVNEFMEKKIEERKLEGEKE